MEITAAVLRLYHKLKLGLETVLRPVLTQLQELRERELRSNRKISDIDNEIARISEQNLVLVRLKSKGYVDSALYLSQMDEIEHKLRELRKLRRRLLETAGEDRQIQETERMLEYLTDSPEWLDEVTSDLFRELIERIIIISPTRLKFRLLNGLELSESIERMIRSMAWQRKTPFGYQIQNGRITCHPEEAESVRYIFSHYLLGSSYNQIADEMAQQGVRYHQHTAQWNKHMVKRILENERYLGCLLYTSPSPRDS